MASEEGYSGEQQTHHHGWCNSNSHTIQHERCKTTRRRFALFRTTWAVIVMMVIPNWMSSLQLHVEVSLCSTERGLRWGILSRTSLKHCIWFQIILCSWFSFANNSKSMQLLAQCSAHMRPTFFQLEGCEDDHGPFWPPPWICSSNLICGRSWWFINPLAKTAGS